MVPGTKESGHDDFVELKQCFGQATHLVLSTPGLVYPSTQPSHTLLAMAFPMAVITMLSSTGQSSRSKDRTRDRCVPRFLCIPEHSIQIRAPRFRLAQSGSEGQRQLHFSAPFQISTAHLSRTHIGNFQQLLCQP